jgi:hypothetical protein
MIRKIGGGDKGVTLKTACTVKSTLQTIVPVLGDLVELSTSGNWVIDEASTNADIEVLGQIVELSDDKKTCVVEWFGYNKAFQATYSGTATLGQYIISGASQADYVLTSSYAANNKFAVCVATDSPASGELEFLAK